MERFAAVEYRQKRTRKRPIRKWSEQEQRELIEFLRNNLPIEKPTAQLYYQRFYQHSNIAIEWRLVRSKVRNLRVLYTKTKYWQSSSEAMLLSEERRRALVMRMCNFFDDFEEISKQKHGIPMHLNEVSGFCSPKLSDLSSPAEISISKEKIICTRDTLSSSIGDSDIDQVESKGASNFIGTTIKVENLEEDLSLPDQTNKYLHNFNNTSDSSLGDTTHKQAYTETYKSIVPENTNIEELQSSNRTLSYCELDESYTSRLDIADDRDFKERKLALKIEKFKFEKEKFMKQHELRKWELESQERIRMLELEMRERIAMRKLHIKERVGIFEIQRK
ncbi:uncharacterized protein LOC129242289 [Anastrepha obliqua]|uniref:uncharacterized protein LOC129242289 n=1 Tax=Anastrepha obliqua TaxID=95512 RepID=UPI002409B160|nr:uncharacterized protein LOC129242289 [Anastrepha obliqua]